MSAMSESVGGKSAIILRGLPGSGKSTYITMSDWSEYECEPLICSADHFFINEEGIYRFEQGGLNAAHEACFEIFQEAILSGHSLVILDNTNSKRWEYQKYVALANLHGYDVQIIHIISDLTAKELAQRNSHDVPKYVIRQMMARFEEDERETRVLNRGYDPKPPE